MAPDPADVVVLIPRVRRGIDGPTALAPDSPSTTLTDDEVTALIADAIAEVIFYTGGLFGHQLIVTARDATYGAPTAWQVDPILTEAEASVIVAEAAINHFYSVARDLKVSEEISDEGQTWSYALSAQVVRDQLKALQTMRDRALAQIVENNPVSTDFVSFLETRDRLVSQIIEPYYYGLIGPGGGQEVLWP